MLKRADCSSDLKKRKVKRRRNRETLRKEVVSLFLNKNDTLRQSESVLIGYTL